VRVSIVGAGYVGLVTGACLAEHGHDVVCADVDPSKVDRIMAGASPIYEPGLEELLARNAGERLRATTDVTRAVAESEVTLLAVGTPSANGRIDLGAVVSATRAIGSALGGKHGYHVVAVKSTVVPGTTDQVVLPLLEEASGKKAGAEFGVAVNPEFLTEGQAVADFMASDRLVLGGIDKRTHAVLEELYAAGGDDQVHVERAARDDDLVRQRDRQSVRRRWRRGRRRRHARRAPLSLPQSFRI
jgi:UDPglucose 6-dehydrogenase